MRVVIAGGGTAGHLFPGIALAHVLASDGSQIKFIGSDRGPEARLVPSAGFSFEPIRISGRGKGASVRNVLALARLVTATSRCLSIIGRFDPDVFVGTGGYASLPAALAAMLHRVPIVVHEQNSVPGLANRVAARFARAVAVSFPGTEKHFGSKGVLTGNPVRREIAAVDRQARRSEALDFFGLAPGRRTLLVTGGSQGARSINEAVLELYVRWRFDDRVQVLHLTGPERLVEVQAALKSLRRPDDRVMWREVPFTQRMDLAYSSADLAICRAGSSTIAEMAAVGLPGIFVPIPIALDDDQRKNAEVVVKVGAGRMILDANLREGLPSVVEELLFDQENLDALSTAAGALSLGDAAERLAEVVRKIGRMPSEVKGESEAPWNRVHMIGVGGAGMSAMARILREQGAVVSGSDRSESPEIEGLRTIGVRVSVGHEPKNVGDVEAVIASTAVKEDNPELLEARGRGVLTLWRGEALARMMEGKRLLGVTGTHGKTTTSSMIATVLMDAGADPTYLLGGEPLGLPAAGRHGKGNLAVVEADEAYGTFLHLHPEIGVVLNVDVDHIDHYGSEGAYREAFVTFMRQSERVVASSDHEGALRASKGLSNVTTYGFSESAQVRGEAVEDQGRWLLRVGPPHDLDIPLQVRGRHNADKALAAFAACHLAGIEPHTIAKGLSRFRGVSRRMEFKGTISGAQVFDDYAHLPEEIEATLQAFGRPQGRLVAIFQPHLYSRTKARAGDFGTALAQADQVVVTDVYPAREEPIEGISGKTVADAVCEAAPGKLVAYLPTLSEAATYIRGRLKEGDLVVTLGAGDVTSIPALLLGERV